MPIIYEVTIKYTGLGQELNNVVYYAPTLEPSQNWTIADQIAIGDSVDLQMSSEIMPIMSNRVTYEGVLVRCLDEMRNTVSPLIYETGTQTPGLISGDVEGIGSCAIIAFACFPVPGFGVDRSPRRSYVAVGPLPAANVADTGEFTPVVGFTAEWVEFFGTTIGTPNAIFAPVRLGVPNALGEPAVGAIAATTVRPFASVRRSRMFTPKGL